MQSKIAYYRIILSASDSHIYYVSVLASRRHGTLYIGVTNDLIRRVQEHRECMLPGFTKRYGVHRLVYFEMFGEIGEAIAREKKLKRWRRDWKIALIEENNLEWDDLWPRLAQ